MLWKQVDWFILNKLWVRNKVKLILNRYRVRAYVLLVCNFCNLKARYNGRTWRCSNRYFNDLAGLVGYAHPRNSNEERLVIINILIGWDKKFVFHGERQQCNCHFVPFFVKTFYKINAMNKLIQIQNAHHA